MKIKKFIVATLQEGKTRILKELGEDAIILSSRSSHKPGEESPVIEIVAAIDDTMKSQASERKSIYRKPTEEQPVTDNSQILAGTGQLFTEIGALKDLMIEMAESVKFKYSNVLSPIVKKIYKGLILSDFSETYALNIAGRISADMPNASLDEAMAYARQLIMNNLSVLPKISAKSTGKIYAFTGTTGCGKTTTVVKLALVLKLAFGADVFLISADTEKVGGADQLRTYASIASIPFQSVYSGEELSDIVQKEAARDYILIDTTGRSQRNKSDLSGIHDIIKSVNIDLLFLVLSSTNSSTNIYQIIKAFEFMKPDSLILSKIDEAVSIGNVIEAVSKFRIPIGYITNGQKIPDDIEPAEIDKIAKIVLQDSVVSDGK
jgi:flagellar biosynthesis protein FlhF